MFYDTLFDFKAKKFLTIVVFIGVAIFIYFNFNQISIEKNSEYTVYLDDNLFDKQGISIYKKSTSIVSYNFEMECYIQENDGITKKIIENIHQNVEPTYYKIEYDKQQKIVYERSVKFGLDMEVVDVKIYLHEDNIYKTISYY